jgi:hypothetical protein
MFMAVPSSYATVVCSHARANSSAAAMLLVAAPWKSSLAVIV